MMLRQVYLGQLLKNEAKTAKRVNLSKENEENKEVVVGKQSNSDGKELNAD